MTTTPLSPAELREMLEKATTLPWEYRPWKHDDWGTIRGPQLPDDEPDYPGPHVAMARAGYYPNDAEMDQHRQVGTDPYGPNATLIVSAVNSLPALLDELDRLRELLSAPAAPTDAQVVQHILDEGERHEDRRLHAAIHGPVSEPPTAPAAPREREKGNLEAIEARVRPTICATFTVLDDGPRTRMEGRISREDFEALLDLAGRGRTVTTDETVAKAISALRTPDASLARVPNTIRQSIADIIEGLASRALAPSTSGGK